MAEAGIIRISSGFRQDFDLEPGGTPHSLSSVGSCGGLTMYRIGIELQRAWRGTVVPAVRTPALLLAACAVMSPAAMAQAEAQVAKRVVRTQDDLPRFTYPLAGTACSVVGFDGIQVGTGYCSACSRRLPGDRHADAPKPVRGSVGVQRGDRAPVPKGSASLPRSSLSHVPIAGRDASQASFRCW